MTFTPHPWGRSLISGVETGKHFPSAELLAAYDVVFKKPEGHFEAELIPDPGTTVPTRLKYFRLKRRLLMRELAALVGRNTAAISGWEDEESTPDSDTLDRLAAALDVKVGDLTDEIGVSF
jgi:transcriptional regulator with XRE-family HTH domain